MKHAIIAALVVLAACGKSAEEEGREASQREAAKHQELEKPPAPPPSAATTPTPDPVPKAAEKPAEPEPTTPAEIDRARNQAMIDGRDKDVLKYCDMQKLDEKSNPQALLGCTLAACRINDVDTARKYSKGLAKAYMDQAKKVCLADKVVL